MVVWLRILLSPPISGEKMRVSWSPAWPGRYWLTLHLWWIEFTNWIIMTVIDHSYCIMWQSDGLVTTLLQTTVIQWPSSNWKTSTSHGCELSSCFIGEITWLYINIKDTLISNKDCKITRKYYIYPEIYRYICPYYYTIYIVLPRPSWGCIPIPIRLVK